MNTRLTVLATESPTDGTLARQALKPLAPVPLQCRPSGNERAHARPLTRLFAHARRAENARVPEMAKIRAPQTSAFIDRKATQQADTRRTAACRLQDDAVYSLSTMASAAWLGEGTDTRASRHVLSHAPGFWPKA